MKESTALQGLDNFLLFFAVAIVAQVLFVLVYTALTPHREVSLIRAGSTAGAVSLGGAVIGFTLPLASVIAHSASIVDMAIWSGIALVAQLAVFLLVDLSLRNLSRKIEAGDVAAAVTLATASMAIGIINAACMVY